jgi:hypothetical protein
MFPEDNPMIVPLYCEQRIVLLTCWLKKASLLSMGISLRKCLQHILQEVSPERGTVFNIVSSSRATIRAELKILIVTYLINPKTKQINLKAFV